MNWPRRHGRTCAGLAFCLLALVSELAGRSLTRRLDVGEHVPSTRYSGADYYPLLLAFVKIGVALLLARLFWRFVKARAADRAARRLLGRLGVGPEERAPSMRIELSARLWALCFGVTSLIFLIQTDAERIASGRWPPLLAPWLHTSALPVFAVLSVLVAVVWRAIGRWLNEYESYARTVAARAHELTGRPATAQQRASAVAPATPRSLFGIAFESRPPPAPV